MPDPDRPPVRWSRPSCSFRIRLTVHPVGPAVRPSCPPCPCVLSVLNNPCTPPVLSVHPAYPAHPLQASSHCCSLVRLSVRPSVLQSVSQSVSPPHQPVPSVLLARPVCQGFPRKDFSQPREKKSDGLAAGSAGGKKAATGSFFRAVRNKSDRAGRLAGQQAGCLWPTGCVLPDGLGGWIPLCFLCRSKPRGRQSWLGWLASGGPLRKKYPVVAWPSQPVRKILPRSEGFLAAAKR